MSQATNRQKFSANRMRLIFAFLIFLNFNINAQEIINDSVKKAPIGRQKIDGIIATVGDYIILDSDIDKNFLELSSQGNSVKDITRCQMLGKLLEERLYAHHAVQDSLKVTDGEINSMIDEKMNVMVEQIGSIEKLVAYYKKNSLEEFKSYFFDILKLNKLTAEMTKKIVEEVEITPEEVRNFFKKIPKEELPIFGDELEVAQIVVTPKVSDAEKQKIIDKLKGFKKEVQEGASFYSKAVLYSQDPGSKSIGGFMKINRKSPLVKEFKETAFSLAEGEISEPFETEYGYHIILVEKIRGQEIDLRHILLFPKVSEDAMKEAKEEITAIRKKIVAKEITFADAARSSSDEKETKANGGALINPKTQDTRFELTKMDPSLYSLVSNLKDNEVSVPQLDENEREKKIYKMVTVTNRISAHTADYAQDYLKIKELALKEKQIKAIAKWTDEKVKETYIKINGEYKECVFINNWLKK